MKNVNKAPEPEKRTVGFSYIEIFIVSCVVGYFDTNKT